MNPAKHFHVLIGAPALADHLPQGPSLVIDADQDQLDHLAVDLEENAAVIPFPCVLRRAALSAESGQLLPWFSYSDKRFDGVLAPEHWRVRAPNLRCLHQQTMSGQSLSELLDDAALPLEEHQTGCLQVRQGDPVAALGGFGAWGDLFQVVQVISPQAEEHWAGVLSNQLESLGFRRQNDALLFKRSGLQMLSSLVEKLQNQRAALVQERDEQLAARRQLALRIENEQERHTQELVRGQELANQRLEEALQELRDLNSSRSLVIEERDQLKQHLDAVELSHAQTLREKAEHHLRETEQQRREIEQLEQHWNQRWDQREQEYRIRNLQQEALTRASSASVQLITDLILGRQSDSPS